MKSILITAGLLAMLPCFLTGCSSPGTTTNVPQEGRIADPYGFNINDYIQAAQELSQALVASGTLDKVAAPPAKVVLSRVQNNTTDRMLNTQQVTDRIRETLTGSGKAMIELSYGVTGATGKTVTENSTGSQYDAINRWKSDSKNQVKPVDFFLFGAISSTSARAGNVKEITLTFRMTMSDNQNREIWSKIWETTKQGTRASVGIVK